MSTIDNTQTARIKTH